MFGMSNCSEEACDEPVRMKGMCYTHGRRAWRNEPTGPRTCEECGAPFVGSRNNARFCTRSCASRHSHRTPGRRTRATPLTVAIDSGDAAAILAAIREGSTLDGGCWIWPKVNGSGYPLASYRRGSVTVHRVALEARVGGKLGAMQAHHACGTSACVNPDHLEPATRRENISEMLERRALRLRIASLEAALRAVAPDHPELLWSEDGKV